MHTARLVGRGRELERLEAALAAASAGGAHVVELRGEPGIGKTRLLSELCARADAAGALVLEGRAFEFERDVPFGVFADALDDYVQSLERTVVERLADGDAGALGAVLPTFAGDAPAAERFHVHRAVRTLLERLPAEPLVLALDDVHWADDASVDLLAYLLRRPPRAAVVLALTLRPVGIPGRLAAALDTAQRDGSVDRIEPALLTRPESDDLVGEGRDGATRAWIFAESGGNPFYLSELDRALARGGAPSSAQGAHGVPASVAGALAAEIAALSERSHDVLEAAAVAGQPFDPETLAAVAGLDEADVLTALDELVASDLVRATDTPRRFGFRHPVVRRAVYDAIAPGRRLAIHARAAAALAAGGAPASVRAHHVEQAARRGDEDAIALLADAGRATVARAPAIACRWFAAALALLPDGHEPLRRLELLLPLARALGVSGRLAESRDALLEVLALLPPEDTAARARVTAFVARVEHPLGRHGEARELLERAIAELPETASGERAVLGLEAAADAFFAGDFARMFAVSETALHDARRAGDGALEGCALSSLALVRYHASDVPGALASLDEAATVVAAVPDAAFAAGVDTLWWLGWTEQAVERFEASRLHFERGIEIARTTGQDYLLAALLQSLAVALGWQGRLVDACDRAETGLDAARVLDSPQLVAWGEMVTCWAATRAGRLDEAVTAGWRAVDAAQRLHGDLITALVSCYLAEALLEAHELGEARRVLARVGDPVLRAPASCYWQAMLARAALAEGDTATARDWAGAAERSAATLGLPCRRGWARTASAGVVLAGGDAPAAVGQALEAAATLASGGEPIGEGRARILAGRALAEVGDRVGAQRELEDAFSLLESAGATRVRDEAARELRRLGHRVAPRGATDGANGVGGLTPREQEVAGLIAEGMTNRQIAERLVLSGKTIERHVSNLFVKLGVTSRTSVAMAVERAREEA